MAFSLFGPNIKKMREKKDVAGLIKILKGTPNIKTLSEAIIALAQMGKPAIEPIFQALRSAPTDGSFKNMPQMFIFCGNVVATLCFLGMGTGEITIEYFLRILKDKSENVEVRHAVAMALGYIAQEQFIDPLIEILNDKKESFFIRAAALRALEKMQDVIGRAEFILGTLKRAQNVADKRFLDRVSSNPLFRGSDRILVALIEALKDEDAAIRSSAARSLGEIATEKAYTPLKKLAKEDSEYFVRKSAEEAMAKIQKVKEND